MSNRGAVRFSFGIAGGKPLAEYLVLARLAEEMICTLCWEPRESDRRFEFPAER